MKTALMVAEKPSLAQNVANILSNGKCSTTKGLLPNQVCIPHFYEEYKNNFLFLQHRTTLVTYTNGTERLKMSKFGSK